MALDKNQEERFKKVVANHFKTEIEEIKDESTIKDDLGGDSLDVVEIVIELEKEFDCNIPDDFAFGSSTVGEVKEALEQTLAR